MYQRQATLFVIGFLIWLGLGSQQNSVLSITKSTLFASISSELPRFMDFLMNTFVIPISEELFWIIGIPYATITIMNLIGKKFEPLRNIWVQIIIVAIICGVTFALFHVGKLFIGFLIAAFIFRAVTIVSVYGDIEADIIPGVTLVPAFALGAHIGNNWGDFGFIEGVGLLWSNPPLGWMVMALMIVFLLSAINFIAEKFFGKRASLGG